MDPSDSMGVDAKMREPSVKRVGAGALCLSLAIFLSADLAAGSEPEEVIVSRALEAIDACYHWAEENGGGGGEERARTIDEGFRRDCRTAKARAAEAYSRFPANEPLSIGILKLNDIGYFELSDGQKKKLCAQYARAAGNRFSKSRRKDFYFSGFCPEQSAAIYGK